MFDARSDLALGRAVGSQFVSDDAFGNQPMLFHQTPQKSFGGPFITFALQDFVQDQAVLINRTPEPKLTAADFHNHFVQMPDIAGPRLPAPQATRNTRPKLRNPPADRFV